MSGEPVLPQGSPDEQAIYWLTWLTSGEAKDIQRRSFEQWLKEDLAHRQAWDNAQALWQDVARLSEAELDRAVLATAPQARPAAGRRRFLAYPSLAAAASVLLATLVWLIDLSYYFADYRTGTGGGEIVTLADGSVIQLNTDTAVSVDYDASGRRLVLHGGEAWFQVAPDPQRPFVVETEYGTVRALGTAFDVRNNGSDVTVTVYEHAVRVQLADGEVVESLDQGESLRFNDTLEAHERQVDLTQASAWHQQRMIFQDRKLQDVIRELNRYRNGQIIIADRQLESLPLTGVFDTGNPEESLQMIRQSLKLSEYRISDYLVFLYR